MSDPSAPLSVTDVDAADLVSPEGAATPVDGGDAVSQGMGGAPAVDDLPVEPAAADDELPEAPAAAGSGQVPVDDLEPALAAAGIGVDGKEPAAEDVVSPPTGEAGRQGSAIDIGLGVVRLGVGAALVVAPRWAGRLWVGPGADGPGSLVFARAIGARDVALGLRILDGARKGEPVRHWITAGFTADLADVVATGIASRHLTPGRRVAMPVIAGVVAALGVVSTRRS